MREPIDLVVDVTEAAGIGIDAHTAVTVHLPEAAAMSDPPVVCFAFPGGGYSRGYFSFDMPGSTGGGQAGWHTRRGWIVVSCDHLGVGESTVPEGNVLNYENVARANKATVEVVMAKLEGGAVADGFPPVRGAVTLGIGQSMGGCFTIVVQGQHHLFDGVGLLGYSAVHTVVPSRPGGPPAQWPWMPRSADLGAPIVVNQAAMAEVAGATAVTGQEDVVAAANQGEHPFAWGFHFDDVPADVVAADLAVSPDAPLPPWRSATTPPCAIFMVAPGTVATEAAAIRVPVLVAAGERDVLPDPLLEAKAYRSARDVTVYVCERMAHMHNFAGTRERFWRRIHAWGETVAAMRH